jgi:adenylylsulfate kinase
MAIPGSPPQPAWGAAPVRMPSVCATGDPPHRGAAYPASPVNEALHIKIIYMHFIYFPLTAQKGVSFGFRQRREFARADAHIRPGGSGCGAARGCPRFGGALLVDDRPSRLGQIDDLREAARRVAGAGRGAVALDGDSLRRGLNRDLGYSDGDRHENIRRTAEVARLMVDAGLIAVVSLISPFRVDRAFARSRFERGRFCEIFIDAPLIVCEQRDPKGLYARARRGELAKMTGIDSPYEAPEHPDLHVHTDQDNVDACVEQIVSWLRG